MKSHAKSVAIMLAVAGASGLGCREAPRPRPTTTAPQASMPATQPLPERPSPVLPAAPVEPYRVHVEVRSLKEPQTGWLRIEQLEPGASAAFADGRWIEPNTIEIETKGTARIAFDLSLLPVERGRRIVLRLDDQGIDLASSLGPIVRFERGPAGVWSLVREKR